MPKLAKETVFPPISRRWGRDGDDGGAVVSRLGRREVVWEALVLLLLLLLLRTGNMADDERVKVRVVEDG